MLGHKLRDFKPLTTICLEDLVPADNFYRQVERSSWCLLFGSGILVWMPSLTLLSTSHCKRISTRCAHRSGEHGRLRSAEVGDADRQACPRARKWRRRGHGSIMVGTIHLLPI
jgi:hypothetical protein